MKGSGRRFGKEKDANHNEIAGVYRDLGLSVYDAADVGQGFPDLVIGGTWPCKHCQRITPQNILVEIKVPGPRGKLNPDQEVFHALWRGPITVVRTMDEALRSVGRGS